MTTEKTNEEAKTPKSERIEDNAEHAIRLEVVTLRRNRDTLEATNRELSIVAKLFDELLEGLEKEVGWSGAKLAERSSLALRTVTEAVAERKQLAAEIGELEKQIDLFHEGQSIMDVLDRHKAEKADLEKSLELTETTCHRELKRNKELEKQNEALEAALDKWEKFGLEVRDKALAAAEISGSVEVK